MLYLDASALVKRYVKEDGSELLIQAMAEASAWSMCRIGYVETYRAVSMAAGRRAAKRVDADWPSFDVVEVDAAISEHAAQLTLEAELRSLDALHLASALLLPQRNLTVATWDVRLHRAALERGLQALPSKLD
jgi:uncharacterized protein